MLFRSAAAAEAERLGATPVGAIGDEVVVLRSPGGLSFCLTPNQEEHEQVRAGFVEVVDQVCLDCPDDAHDAEVRFWADLTGWEWADVEEPELSLLRRPAGIPLRLLFQRLGEPTGAVRAHADLACTDREASTARHLAAGATDGKGAVHPPTAASTLAMSSTTILTITTYLRRHTWPSLS